MASAIRPCPLSPITSGKWRSSGPAILPPGSKASPASWPEDACQAVPGHLLGTLTQLVQHVLETSASTWYGDDLPASRRQLEAVLRICGQHGVIVPELEQYGQHDASLRAGWGPALTDAELITWKALV
ncbi:hypothetical protein [Janthinobacterium sp.]|uniref:hypothetical protein n=1 Tax=Janthinobacterium sp. TaxID=1871054 RepID=UPI00258580F4|nr:hypothetical protein [Janthinobacterium sp.]MCX7290255.1 hypothetical protein [Janthinobacterium sp.]